MFYPFYPYWATPPNYIKVENEYGEFYYNQEAYDEHYGQRHYKGAEITAYFSTIKDGWYGYKFCLLDLYQAMCACTLRILGDLRIVV